MDDFKDDISKEVLDSLTMEDLWKSPRIKKLEVASSSLVGPAQRVIPDSSHCLD